MNQRNFVFNLKWHFLIGITFIIILPLIFILIQNVIKKLEIIRLQRSFKLFHTQKVY